MEKEQPVNTGLLQALVKLRDLLDRLHTSAHFAHSELKDSRPEIACFYLSAISSGVEAITQDMPLLIKALRDLKVQQQECMNTYTDLGGNSVTVEKMQWLENARYWKPSDHADDAVGEWLPCSLYWIGIDEDSDDITVWLNADRQEVKA